MLDFIRHHRSKKNFGLSNTVVWLLHIIIYMHFLKLRFGKYHPTNGNSVSPGDKYNHWLDYVQRQWFLSDTLCLYSFVPYVVGVFFTTNRQRLCECSWCSIPLPYLATFTVEKQRNINGSMFSLTGTGWSQVSYNLERDTIQSITS